ncbi:MAG: methyltransferase dimerization domain-containing protein, partial [Alphaproteobacteria bacterium]
MADGGDPGATLQRLIDGHRISQAIHAAAVLGIADAIGEQARGVSEIAAATACDGPSLHRLLRALAAVGVLHEGEDGRFTLTPVGACLCAGAPRARAAWASLAGVASVRAAWGALAAGVRTGTTPFVTVHGHDVWTHRSGLAGESAIFDAAMREAAARAAPGILAAGGFARFRRIVDVGGGDGAL